MKRKTIIILFLLGLFILVVALWPSDNDGNNSDEESDYTEIAEGEESGNDKKTAEKKDPEQKEIEDCEYEPTVVYVPQNTSLQEAVYVNNTYIQNVETSKNVGGTKLIAEMSADVDGINTSRNAYNNCEINIYPMNVLKIHLEQNITKSVFYKIKKTDITMISSKVSIHKSDQTRDSQGDDWGSILSLLGEFINALLNGCKMEVNLILINNTSKPEPCEIPQGQMLETEAENAQNLVVYETINFIIQPHQQVEVTLPVYCAAHKRGSPVGSNVRLTPYVLNAPSSVYKSQQDVWNYIEAPARNRIVFYCWGVGDLRNGGRSKTGHAFVHIPQIGYVGFGSIHGKKEILDDDGNISDHTNCVKDATDSCVCYITDMQLEKVKSKYYELHNKIPRYKLGRYDCTSFTMDIADAAEIYYGGRKYNILAQTPVGFIRQMKRFNQKAQ